MSYHQIQDVLSIAASTVQIAAALFTLYGVTAMRRKSNPAQLDLFTAPAPAQLEIPVVPTEDTEYEPPTEADATPIEFPSPWELTDEDAIAWGLPAAETSAAEAPRRLHPPTPYLLALPPARPLTVAELRQVCRDRGLKIDGRWGRAKLEATLAV